MGRDIYMHILSPTGALKHRDIFDGRNSEWFDNLTGRGFDPEYEYLPYSYGMPDLKDLPEEFKTLEDKNCYSDVRNISAGDFRRWFSTYKPHEKAGWTSRWKAWMYKNKNIVPEDVLCFREEDADPDDCVFVEYTDFYEPSCTVINTLDSFGDVRDDDIIIYYFDW